MSEKTEVSKTGGTKAAMTNLVPTAITVEIAGYSRTRFRSRCGESVRVAVTYRWEGPENAPKEEDDLARIIRRCVRSSLQAYRLSRTTSERRVTASLAAPSIPIIERVPLNGTNSFAVMSLTEETVREPKASPDTKRVVPIQETNPIGGVSFPLHAVREKEEIKVRKSTLTQQRTLEIMARQLNLEGQCLIDLLGLRCNKTSLESLNYREAAGLIAHFSGQLRQRLQKEREDKESAATTAK